MTKRRLEILEHRIQELCVGLCKKFGEDVWNIEQNEELRGALSKKIKRMKAKNLRKIFIKLCIEVKAYEFGVFGIIEAHQKVAKAYIVDGSISDACPPLQAVLYIMAEGHYEGKTVDDPSIREMFSLDYLLQSDWYQERLKIKQQRDAALWQMNRDYVEQKMDETNESVTDLWATLQDQMENAEQMLEWVNSDSYLQRLQGTLGADWIHRGA